MLQVQFQFTFEEVFGNVATIEAMRARLSEYRAESVIKLCSYLNFAFEWLQFQPNKKFADALLFSLFSEPLRTKVLDSGRPVLNRRQLLLVAHEAARAATTSGKNPVDDDGLGSFGEILLMANDLAHRDRPAETTEELRDRILINFIPLMEYMSSSLKYTVVRGYKLGEILATTRPTAGIDIPQLFESSSGLSIDTFRAFCLAIVSRYVNSGGPQRFPLNGGVLDLRQAVDLMGFETEWLSNTRLPQPEKDFCFSETSADLVQLSTAAKKALGIEDFTALRSRPLFFDGTRYFPIDIAFVTEKIETGPFWFVQSRLDKKKREDSLMFWGTSVERYVHWLLDVCSTQPALNKPIPAPCFDNSEEEICDAAVVCPNNAVVMMECKGGFVNAKAKYGDDPSAVWTEIEKKLIENEKGEPKGIQQLASSIKRAYAAVPTMKGTALGNPKHIFPVIVIRDDIGAAPVVNYRLNQEFQRLLANERLSAHVMPLTLLSLRALEDLSAYMEYASFTDLLYGRILLDREMSSPYWIAPNLALAMLGVRNNSGITAYYKSILPTLAGRLFEGGAAIPG